MAAITKSAKVTFNKSGSGSTSARVTIPMELLRAMGIDENHRDIEISYFMGSLRISRKEVK